MDNDLATDESGKEEVEGVVEMTTCSEYVECAVNALNAMDCFDKGMMSKIDQKRIERTKRKSLIIIHNIICQLADELEEDNEED